MANVDPLRCEIKEICRKDSLALTADDRRRIREAIERSDERYIVITHGTDTMCETAHALAGMTDKVIVITGAMQPAAFTHTDGIFNLGFALAAVQLAPPGVHISMNGRLFDPRKARKNQATSTYEDLREPDDA
jgi:L-asparaginase